jgi:integrase
MAKPVKHGNAWRARWVDEHGRRQSKTAFQERLHAVLERADFPDADPVSGQPKRHITFHDLRHTFASHFIMNGGNILALQRILGHTSLAMTMRYAHLAPDHLQDAVRLGPITDYRSFFGRL